MKAGRIHQFGPPDVVVIDEIPVPTPIRNPNLRAVRAGARAYPLPNLAGFGVLYLVGQKMTVN